MTSKEVSILEVKKCRESIKSQAKFDLPNNIETNSKNFFIYLSTKRRMKK